MNPEIKKLTLDWHEKEKLPAVNLISVWTELFDIDKKLCSCNARLEEVGLGTGYRSQSNELNDCVEGVNALDMYILQLHPYIDSKLDDPLYKGFVNGPTETISRIRLNQFSTDNLPGITDTSNRCLIRAALTIRWTSLWSPSYLRYLILPSSSHS